MACLVLLVSRDALETGAWREAPRPTKSKARQGRAQSLRCKHVGASGDIYTSDMVACASILT